MEQVPGLSPRAVFDDWKDWVARLQSEPWILGKHSVINLS